MYTYPKRYDVIVVGAGHAGIEAVLAAARMGCKCLLLTTNADTIGQMSCNPAIGGQAKGHLVREIDALGGEMGINTDFTGIQFRMLNTKKGPAVWSPRAQCDKKAYQFRMKWVCESHPNIDVKQGQATRLIHAHDKVAGVEINLGVAYLGQTVVITTGTFLKGLMHIGQNQHAGGRAGEAASHGISESLIQVGHQLGRLKTGTPPRLLKSSIDFEKTQVQPGDEPVPYFSHWKEQLFHMEQFSPTPSAQPLSYVPNSILSRSGKQLDCFITYTTSETERIIRENLHRSPMYSGVIEGVGPRYCPSIEDKIVKFPDKEKQQIFLEPEGVETDEIYVNGFSTCLPYEVQVRMVQTIIGCENAEIMRPAYAVEYDFSFPTQLHQSLESKVCENLFLAGQINGTSGYEEAAAQGIMAGINAALRVAGKPPFVLQRSEAYIGVLIDDLVTKGTVEPYRMFTSRSEHRLTLRQDNADIRLSKYGYQYGLINAKQIARVQAKEQAITSEVARLNSMRHEGNTLAQILKRPEKSYQSLPSTIRNLHPEVIQQVEIAIKYEGYIDRQQAEVERTKSLEDKQIPIGFDYTSVPSLRLEARQKLAQIRPGTIGQASRISGVSPSDIGILLVWLKRGAAKTETDDGTCD